MKPTLTHEEIMLVLNGMTKEEMEEFDKSCTKDTVEWLRGLSKEEIENLKNSVPDDLEGAKQLQEFLDLLPSLR